MDWWLKFINKNSSDDASMNTVFGEYYSNLVKMTHKTNNYESADEYGVACYLANLTRNNYDKDFYQFEKYDFKDDILKINLDTRGIEEDEELAISTYKSKKDGSKWEFETKNSTNFSRWIANYESGLVNRIAKMNTHKNLYKLYMKSSVGQHIRKEYNQANKKKGEKYSVDLFYKMLRNLVEIEVVNENTKEIVERVGSTISYKEVSIKVVGICPKNIGKKVEKTA